MVYRIKGKGTYIRRNNKSVMNIGDAAVQGTRGIAALVRSYGILVRSVVLVSGTITGNKFLESKLELQEGEPVFALHRVRYGNNEPLAIEYTYVPKNCFRILKISISEWCLYMTIWKQEAICLRSMIKRSG